MRFKRDFDTQYWQIDDPAGLHYSVHGSAELPPPEVFHARCIGHFNRSPEITMPVETASLAYLGTGLFGPPRPCGTGSTTRWTGDSYKFAIYHHKTSTRGCIVILRTDGSGFYAYLDDHTSTVCELWEHLVRVCDPPMLWNICYELVFAYESGREDGEHRICKAFLEKRLKRRGRGAHVLIVPAARINSKGGGEWTNW